MWQLKFTKGDVTVSAVGPTTDAVSKALAGISSPEGASLSLSQHRPDDDAAVLRELFGSPAADAPASDQNVTIDIYGEGFHFKASRDEARRLIKAFERVLAARRSVRRLQDELEVAKVMAFDCVSIGAGAGIVVDDPDAGGKAEAA